MAFHRTPRLSSLFHSFSLLSSDWIISNPGLLSHRFFRLISYCWCSLLHFPFHFIHFSRIFHSLWFFCSTFHFVHVLLFWYCWIVFLCYSSWSFLITAILNSSLGKNVFGFSYRKTGIPWWGHYFDFSWPWSLHSWLRSSSSSQLFQY